MSFCYQDGWFPFAIPEIAEDGLPFSVWDGTTLFGRVDADLTSGDFPDDGHGNSQSTTGYSYYGYPSKDSGSFVTTVGQGSPYSVGPFTLEQLCEFYWRVRDWTFSITPFSAITSGTQSIGTPITGSMFVVRWDGTDGNPAAVATPFDLVVTEHPPYHRLTAAVSGYVSTNYSDYPEAPPDDIYTVSFSISRSDDLIGATNYLAPGWSGLFAMTPVQFGEVWGYTSAPVVAQVIPATGSTPARTQYWLGGSLLFGSINLLAFHSHTTSPQFLEQSSASVINPGYAGLSEYASILKTFENWSRTTVVGGMSSTESHLSAIIRNTVTLSLNTGTISATIDSQSTGSLPLPALLIALTPSHWHDYGGIYNTSTGSPV